MKSWFLHRGDLEIITILSSFDARVSITEIVRTCFPPILKFDPADHIYNNSSV